MLRERLSREQLRLPEHVFRDSASSEGLSPSTPDAARPAGSLAGPRASPSGAEIDTAELTKAARSDPLIVRARTAYEGAPLATTVLLYMLCVALVPTTRKIKKHVL